MFFSSQHVSTPSRSRVRGSTALVIAAGLGVVGIMQAAPAAAAELDDAISNITVSNSQGTTPIGRYQSLTVTADWAVPDNSAPGDTFSMTLPPELEGLTDTFELPDVDDESFGTCTVSATVVNCTLSDLVTSRPIGVGGTLFFSGRFTDQIDEGQVNDLVFDTGTTTETVPVDVGQRVGYGGNGFTKSGAQQPDGSIIWFVTLPQGPTGLEQTLTNVVVTDTLADSLTFVGPERIRLVSGTALNSGGTAPLYTTEVDRALYSVTITGQVATVTIPTLAAGPFYRIVIDTVPVAGAEPPFVNSATLTATERPGIEDAVSTVDYDAGGTGSGELTPGTTPVPTPTPTPTPTVPVVSPAAGNAAELANTGITDAYAGQLAALALMLLAGGGSLLALRRRTAH